MKIGDKVIMNDKYMVADKNKDKVFTVRSEPWDLCGTDCVLLEDYMGGYAVDGLTVVLYCEILNDTEQYNFMVSIGGTFHSQQSGSIIANLGEEYKK